MQKSSVIIGISGKMGSGKDTLADLIIEKDPSFKKVSFAAKLKRIGAFMTGTEEFQWFSQEGKNVLLTDWGMTIGEFQQRLGTDAIRYGLHSEAWVLSLFADFKPDSRWIITDMRFPNEAKAVTDRGGYTVRLNGDPAKVRANSSRNLNHPSETSLDDYNQFDFTYSNTNSLNELGHFSRLILETIK
jgi:hypothetical protein